MNQLEYQYHVMFDNMAQGAFYQLADGSLADVNTAALAMFGLSRDEFLGHTNHTSEWRVITEDGADLPPERQPCMAALSSGQPVRDFVAGIYNQQQQRFIWLSVNAIPMFREGEAKPYQVFVTLHDITEQKRMNDLHLSRIHLMQFANTHPLDDLLVAALDELERLTGSDTGFYHFFDERNGFITMKAWSTRAAGHFCKVPDKGGHYSTDQAGVWSDCIRTGEPVIHNDYAGLPHRRGLPEGHAPVIREMVVPVKRNGKIIAILGIGNKPVNYTEADVQTASLFADLTWDIAEQKQMQDDLLRSQNELKLANELLEHRVAQRTADLQAAVREQESFSYSVSHDLRAPLRHINSFSAIMNEEYGECLPSDARDYLNRIGAASSRMGALIDHLLELSRVTRAELAPGTVNLSRIAAETFRMFEETEPQRRVERDIQPGMVTIGDQHLLDQLLGNLLGNAWKYTARVSSARIEFGRTKASGQDAYYVRDNGAGFDMTYKENLFKAFQRLHGSEFEGIGIGLATAQRIIARHGGKIWAEGEVDRGATFYFTLPDGVSAFSIGSGASTSSATAET